MTRVLFGEESHFFYWWIPKYFTKERILRQKQILDRPWYQIIRKYEKE